MIAKQRVLLGICVLAFGRAAPLLAHAQSAAPDTAGASSGDTLEEVIVTAERRSTDVQKVGLVVSAINGAAPICVQKAYTIVNASLTFSPASQRYHLTAHGRNFGNTIYKTTILQGATFVNDPRTCGVIVSATF